MLRSLRAGGTGIGSKKAVLIGAALAAVAIALVVVSVGSATQQPIEMKFSCALKSNGLMRYVSSLNQCKNTENKVTIRPGPTRICIQPSGSVRYVTSFNSSLCKPPAIQLTLPANGTTYFCAANSTGVLRYVTDPSQCTSSEFPVFVGP